MSVDKKYLQLIDQIITVSMADQTRIIGITGLHDSDSMAGFSEILAESFSLAQTRTLLVTVSGEQKADEQNTGGGNSKDWMQLLKASSSFAEKGTDSFERMEIHPDKANRFLFNNTARIRQFIDENLGDYGAIIFVLPEMVSQHLETVSPVSCAAACDSVYLICRTGETTRPELSSIRNRLDNIGVSLKGIILDSSGHLTTGQGMARAARRARWIPGMKSLASRLEKLDFLE